MDIEWAKDGRSGELFIVQARPETVQSRAQTGVQRTYTVARKGRKLTSGFLAVCRTVCRCHVQ
jgi:pyruvate,water dikinase